MLYRLILPKSYYTDSYLFWTYVFSFFLQDVPPLSSFLTDQVPVIHGGILYYWERRGLLGSETRWKKRLCFLDEARLYVFDVPNEGSPGDDSSVKRGGAGKDRASLNAKRGWAIELEDVDLSIEEAPCSGKSSPKMPRAFFFAGRGIKVSFELNTFNSNV